MDFSIYILPHPTRKQFRHTNEIMKIVKFTLEILAFTFFDCFYIAIILDSCTINLSFFLYDLVIVISVGWIRIWVELYWALFTAVEKENTHITTSVAIYKKINI